MKIPVPPPAPQKPLQVDYAEFIALRTIVMALIAERAIQYKALKGGSQEWINDVSALCQESVIASKISISGADISESRFRAKVLDKINDILGGVRLPANLPDIDPDA